MNNNALGTRTMQQTTQGKITAILFCAFQTYLMTDVRQAGRLEGAAVAQSFNTIKTQQKVGGNSRTQTQQAEPLQQAEAHVDFENTKPTCGCANTPDVTTDPPRTKYCTIHTYAALEAGGKTDSMICGRTTRGKTITCATVFLSVGVLKVVTTFQ